jgi:hypothetical protein
LIDCGGILGENHLREEEHLIAEDFVTVEVVTEETGIRVREIVSFVKGDVWEATELLVDERVLSVRSVEMLTCVFVSLILAE